MIGVKQRPEKGRFFCSQFTVTVRVDLPRTKGISILDGGAADV